MVNFIKHCIIKVFIYLFFPTISPFFKKISSITAGEPHAALISLVLKFASIYGLALAYIDKGNGVRKK